MTTATSQIRTKFFDYVFNGREGFVCIAIAEPKRARQTFRQSWFRWPNQREDIASFVEKTGQKKNMWYSPILFDKAERKRASALPGNIVWADLDTADPNDVTPVPNVIIESSPGRYQALWRLSEVVSPEQAQEYSKRVAYEYKQEGADPSGWDIEQLLRIPLTRNFKYESQPTVKLLQATDDAHELEEFEVLTQVQGQADVQVEDMPDLDKLPDLEQIIYKYHIALRGTAFTSLYTQEPNRQDDWSKMLWRLIHICIEAGMTMEETFTICNAAGCNKYRRDERPPSYLWRDVVKATTEQAKLTLITATFTPLQMPQLATYDDVTRTFVDDYREWATEATDALPAYHDLCAFTLLSTFVAGGLYLKTQYTEKLVPNIWGLLLGDSTLTRKTTAMRLTIDLINEIDSDLILATDGSVEGLLTGLSLRPNRVSMFWKDEVSGFFDSINRKDYLAGMPETLTQLYDVPPIFSRRLRKETITLSSPIFIFFGGGIRDKVYSLTSEEYVLSGFLPRFLVISGDADVTRIRRTGPPTMQETVKRNALKSQLVDMYENYNRTAIASIGGKQVELEAGIEATLTPDAWKRYGDIEMEMVSKASESPISMIALPTFERLSRSCLKMACLLAASSQIPDEEHKIEVSEQDVTNASAYISTWGGYSADLISNAGKGTTQRTLDKIMRAIRENPGVTRSWIMQRYHLSSREANEVFNTLADRGEIRLAKEGRGARIWAI